MLYGECLRYACVTTHWWNAYTNLSRTLLGGSFDNATNLQLYSWFLVGSYDE